MEKGFTGMIIVLCIAIALAAFAYYDFESKKVDDTPPPQPPQPPAPPGPGTIELPEPEPEELTPRVLELLGNADKRVHGLEYYYRGPPDPSIVPKFTVKGSLVKVDLDSESTVSLDDYYDTVFINADTESAVAYCRDVSHIRCPDKEKTLTVDFNEYYRITPYQWTKMLIQPVESGTARLQDRDVVILQETLNDIPTRMWVDTFYGLPLRIEQTINGEVVTTNFDELLIYRVAEEDVTP